METEKGFFLVRTKTRMKIESERILNSWSFPRVVKSTEAALAKYPILGSLGYRDGSLIFNIKDGSMYIISENKRRPVVGVDVLDAMGLVPSDFQPASDSEIQLHELGEELN